MKNLANRKQNFFEMKTFVAKEVLYVLQSSEKNNNNKQNKTESTKYRVNEDKDFMEKF